MEGREAVVGIPSLVPEEDHVWFDGEHLFHETLPGWLNVAIESAVREQQHARAMETSFRLEIQQGLLDRAQRHRAIHRIFGQRIGFHIERLSTAKHHPVVVRFVAVSIDQHDVPRPRSTACAAILFEVEVPCVRKTAAGNQRPVLPFRGRF